MNNKETVINFYDLIFNQKRPAEPVAKYVGKEYIQHNPHVRSCKDGFTEYFERMAGHPRGLAG